jgi:hypothetical protein
VIAQGPTACSRLGESPGIIMLMIRLLYIADDALRERVRAKVAAGRDMPAAMIPDWWELDDADYSAILIEIHAEDRGEKIDDAGRFEE